MADGELATLSGRFLSGQGIANLPFQECAESLVRPHVDHGELFFLTDRTNSVARVLEWLSILSVPASRHVAFAASDEHTVMVNNHRNGSDYADSTTWLAKHLAAPCVRILNREGKLWRRGDRRIQMQYAAILFELYDSNGDIIRSVTCSDDGGHWSFNQAGSPHPIELDFPYKSRKIRDRFQTDHLNRLIQAFGFPLITPETMLTAESFLLLERPGPTADSCTLAEADDPAYLYFRRGMNWVPHIETHATSVIADFEMCVELNPSYESKVRQHIIRAKQIAEKK